MLLYPFVCIILASLQMYLKNKNGGKRLVYLTLPPVDYIVIFNAAVGEEFIFRILPHLIVEQYYEIRLVISSIIFGLLHGIPLIRSYKRVINMEIVVSIMGATTTGLVLISMEKLFTLPIYWYITCCVIHGLNNIIVIRLNNRDIIYNPGTDKGFVTKRNN